MAGYKYLKTLDFESQQEIIDFYLAPNTLADTCKKFNICDRAYLKKFLIEHSIQLHSKETIYKLNQLKTENTNLKKYGVKYPAQNKEIRQKQLDTCTKNYGVPYPGMAEVIKEKIKQVSIKKYGKPCCLTNEEIHKKALKTKLKKYGDENYNNRKAAEQTCLNKYGIKNPMTCVNGIESKFRLKSYKTKLNKGLYCTSKEEKIFYQEACKKFNKEDIKRQYRDVRYPFNCDFYIKPLDTFIELNIHWTHGPHKFDKNNLDDIKFLNYWQNKATTINGYNDAIKVWTTKDPLKFKVAAKNNLIYKVFYTLEEALNWLKEIN